VTRRLSLLLLTMTACGTATRSDAYSPAQSIVRPPPAVQFPRGAAIYRPECFGYDEDELMVQSPIRAPAKGKSSPAPGRSYQSAPAAPMPEAASAPAEHKAAADDWGGGMVGGVASGGPTGISKEAERAELSREEPPPAELYAPRPPTGSALEWGATVYLSNDDSMSLASAQRVLYALMNGRPLPVSEIRPHELLNYFSFDHVTPDPDQMFDVLASARRDGDKLTVALAVKGATPPRQELDLTLLVDRSCSMEAEGRMDYTKRGLSLMSEQLRAGDRVDLVLFDDSVCVPLENYVVGRDDPNLFRQAIAQMAPRGSTDVGLGVRKAYAVAKSHYDVSGRNRRVVLLTDALMNTGDVDPNTVSEIGRAFDADGIRLTGVGVGSDFNDDVLNKLTEKGKGAYVFLGSEAVVDRVFGPAGFDALVQTIAHDVHFALKLPPSLAMERFYGEEMSTDRAEVQPIHYSAGNTQLFLEELAVRNNRLVPTDAVVLEVDYIDAVTGRAETRSFRTTLGAMLAADPHNVDKGLALMAFTDWLTARALGGATCGEEVRDYASRASRVGDDAEIAFVNGLVRKECGELPLVSVITDRGGVPFKVRVDSDIPITAVSLACAGSRTSDALSGSDTIASFTARPGVCDLTLSGTVDMVARVEVPSVGGDLRCVIRGGRLSCS
jgi:Ca-activated chloride channel homolog